MKKIKSLLIITIVFIICIATKVQAVEYKQEDFLNGDIIIGTYLYHMQPDETIGYTGRINTSVAMLAAKSIDGNSVDDMSIYFKLNDTYWRNYLTSTRIDPPESIEITHVNGQCIDITCNGEKYNITFAQSEFNEEKIIALSYNSKVKESDAPQIENRTGYKFTYWSLVGETDPYDFDTPITQAITLEANWEQIEYDVIYHSNFGTNTSITDSKIKYYDTKPDNYIIKDFDTAFSDTVNAVGMEFLGWAKTPYIESQEELIASGTNISTLIGNDEKINLYAIWKDNTFILVYNSASGEIKKTCIYGQICLLNTFTPDAKTGYEFEHWYIEENETKIILGEYVSSLTAENNKEIEIKAEYEPIEYTINYNLNGAEQITTNPNTINITEETGVELVKNPTKEGYTFSGWKVVNNDYATIENNAGTYTLKLNEANLDSLTSKTINLEAEFVVNTLTIALYNDTVPYKDSEDNEIIISCNYEEKAECIIKNTFTPAAEPEITFEGWENNGLIYRDDTAIINSSLYTDPSITDTVVFKSVWSNKTSHTIKYVLNGGTWAEGAEPNTKLFIDQNTALPDSDAILKTGYTFKGWLLNKDDEPQNAITELNSITEDTTLYASWEAIHYSVVLHNGDTEVANIDCEYGTECELGDHSSLFDSFNKVGWGYNDEHLFLGDNIKIINLTDKEEIINLYLVTLPLYNVSFNTDGGTLEQEITDALKYESNLNKLYVDLDDYIPEKEGYNFEGWIDENTATLVSNKTEITADTVFTATWSKKKYTLTFTIGENTKTIEDVEYETDGSTLTLDVLTPEEKAGKWKFNDIVIDDISAYISTQIITSNLSYTRLFSITLNTGTNEDVIDELEYEHIITESDLNEINLDDLWLDNENILYGYAGSLKDFLIGRTITSDLKFTRAFKVEFYEGTEMIEQKFFECGKVIEPNNDFDTSITSNTWELNGVEEDLETYFAANPIISNLEFHKIVPTPTPDPEEPDPEDPVDPVDPSE